MERTDIPSLEYLKDPRVWIVTSVRFAAALYILINPLWGFILSLIFDFLDAQVLIGRMGISRAQYHIWDKTVDWLAYVTEFLVTVTYGLYLPFFILLFWRFAGQFMFFRFQKTVVFVLFPNIFETVFFWLIVFHPNVSQFRIEAAHPWEWLLILLMAKVIQEILLHYVWPKAKLPHFEDLEKMVYRRLTGNG